MNNIKINYSVELNSSSKKTLDVKMFITGLKDMTTLKLYKGNSMISAIKSFIPVTIDATCINFELGTKDTCLIEYTAHLGMPSKHGQYGDISAEAISFCGEEVLLLPFESLDVKEDKTKLTFEIEAFFKFKNFKNSLIPFNTDNKTIVTANTFSDIFEFLKSAYVFTNNSETLINSNFSYYSITDINSTTKNNLANLYDYYKNLFNTDINLVISSLSKDGTKNTFSGGANSNICASFDLKDKKDLKFLSHRMFYAFLESKVKTQAMHIPPNLWVTKGLAAYYESKALEVFDDTTKNELNLSFDEDMKRLYRIYLYSLKTNEKIFSIPPIVEGSLKSSALLEYLHTIKAPLLIKFFEENSDLEHSDKFINYLISIDDLNKFSQPDMFKAILKEKTAELAQSYIFNSRSLVFDMDLKGDTDMIRKEFLEFDSLMNALFTLDKNRFESSKKETVKS